MNAPTPRPLLLITGASAGLGEGFARLYAAHGWDLALTARRAGRLETLAAELRARHGAQVLTIPLDLAEPGATRRDRATGAVAITASMPACCSGDRLRKPPVRL